MASHNSGDYAARDEATAILQAAADANAASHLVSGSTPKVKAKANAKSGLGFHDNCQLCLDPNNGEPFWWSHLCSFHQRSTSADPANQIACSNKHSVSMPAQFACVAAATGGSGSLKRTREYAPGIVGSMPTALKSSPAQPPPLLLNVASLQQTQASASATRDIEECLLQSQPHAVADSPQRAVAQPRVANLQTSEPHAAVADPRPRATAKPYPRALGDDSDSSEDLTTYICRTFRQKHSAETRGSVLVNQCDPICASARPTRSAAPSTGGAELATPSQLRCDTATSAADASTDRAEPTTAGCGGKTLTWLPNPAWQTFSSQAHAAGYPISFELQHSCVECKACLLRILNSVNNHGKLCYVGTTENPIRRWAGDKRPIPATCAAKPHAQSQVKGGRGLLAKGHGKRFDHMTVLALVPQRTVAHRLEQFLIKVAKWARGVQCVNKAEDARGQSQEDQYLYVCVGELPRDNPFPYSVPLYPNALKFTPQ